MTDILLPFQATTVNSFLNKDVAENDSNSVNDANLPYSQSGLSLKPGCIITIAGFFMPADDGHHNSINLDMTNTKVANFIALHMSVRASDKVIVFNSMENNKWKKEQKVECYLTLGRAFCCSLFVTPTSFLIAVNEKHIFEFEHRTPVEDINNMNICGNHVKIASVFYEVDFKYAPVQYNNALLREIFSLIYPRNPYNLLIKDVKTKDGETVQSFLQSNTICEVHFRSLWSSKIFKITFSKSNEDCQKMFEIELFVNHSQGKVTVMGKEKHEFPLWSLIGLTRNSQCDIFIVSLSTSVKIYLNGRCVLTLSKTKYGVLKDGFTELQMTSNVSVNTISLLKW